MMEEHDIKNIGPVSRPWLTAVGVSGRADLQRLGAVEVFCRIRDLGLAPSLNLLWALEGAVQDKPFHAVSESRKKALREELRRREKTSSTGNKNKSQNRK